MERLFITKAENMGDLTVTLTFSDNTVQTMDIGDFIRRPPIRSTTSISRHASSAASPLKTATSCGARIGI